MSFHDALRYTELILGAAFFLQSLEHLAGPMRERLLYGVRAIFALILMSGVFADFAALILVTLSFISLGLFQGPYNGGSDRMGYLTLYCLTFAHWLPDPVWKEIALGYLGMQLVLSYFISGWVKIINPDWRSGRALADVFAFSAYPVSEALRNWSSRCVMMRAMSWAVMGFELLFPFAILSQPTLWVALVLAALFHLANACLFGLNRFFWIWLAAYPSLLWLQDRLVG